MPKRPWEQGAADLASAIAEGAVSARTVVDALLDRIEEGNPAVNAVTAVLADEARAAADAADRTVERGGPVGRLHGVPFTVKENVDLAGSATTQGVPGLADALPDRDAPQPARLRAAGAIPIGRTNLPDFGLRWHTDNDLHGATRNPWDPGRTPGGSSGGEAAALAVGMTPLGIGNDLGGSLRIPSHCCGTAALKPTVGRIPHASSLTPQDPFLAVQLMGVQGPMARHVRDLRLAYEVAAGPSPRDPKSVPVPLDAPGTPSPVPVAVAADPGGLGVDPGIAAGVRAAADALSDAGHRVVEVQPPRVEEAAIAWRQAVMADVAVMRPLLDPFLSDDARTTLELSVAATDTTPPAVARAYVTRHACQREWSQFLADTPLVLGPTMTAPPFPVGRDLQGEDAGEEVFAALRFVVAVNALGLPAVALPAGAADGLPRGVQVVGPRFREDLCLDAAEAIEQRLGTLTPVDPARDHADLS